MKRTVLLIGLMSLSAAFAIAQDPPVNQGTPPKLKGAESVRTVPAATPTPAASPDDELIKVETNLVTTPVSVLDRQGRFIPGLKKRDFKIFEDGVPQTITYFASEETPFTVVLLIDVSPSTKYKIDEIHYAAVTFVNQLRPTDKVMVIAFDQRIRVLSEPTSDKTKLYSAIYKANFGSGTSLYEAVNFTTNLDLINVTGRKAVVLFTDGVDTTSRTATLESTVAGVQEVDALFYPVRYNTATDSTASIFRGPGGAPAALPSDIAALLAQRGITIDPRAARMPTARGNSINEYERGKKYLEALALNTGGRMFDADSITNMEEAFKGVAEELRRQYSIGYYPENPGQPGERKSVKIRVPTKPNAVVRAKAGYVIRQTRSDVGTGTAGNSQAAK
jgi:Ca-activated chloride channel homolog